MMTDAPAPAAGETPLHEHSALIDALGGPAKIRDHIFEKTQAVISTQAISQWRTNGVSWKYRALLDAWARERDLADKVPEGFIVI